ncbi:hypothetical protein BCV69DRAFT_11018 [Microstroma glucosiphilum]|uniref:Uncharacterized protein n=1 Tax=Pseudomicrostroma glucosiphilum TaxID=1684307 RepID=A0A316UF39_9BASI|nr:hypothetical protein BCV69DRAFT_11018 [Pseudomicrostroma glucosiphilum]PWN23820.1 hypothetical protein BCV69DRAFT_11018 [Pseudomicrostroma glucosiphilum]
MPASTCPSQWLLCASLPSFQSQGCSPASLTSHQRPYLPHLPAFLPPKFTPSGSLCQLPPVLSTCELFPSCPRRRRRSSRRSRSRRFSPSLAGVIEDSEEEEDFAREAGLSSGRGSDSSCTSSTESFPLRRQDSPGA